MVKDGPFAQYDEVSPYAIASRTSVSSVPDSPNARTSSYNVTGEESAQLLDRPHRRKSREELDEDETEQKLPEDGNVTIGLDDEDEPHELNGHVKLDGHSNGLNGVGHGIQPRRRSRNQEFVREMIFQTIPMLFLSLVGSVLAGEVLARLKLWTVFVRVEELFILVPIILNLKGNLEMNLAARFSTSANIGELDIRSTRQTLVLGNMALLQVQALIVSLIAGIVSFLLGLASRVGISEARSDDRGGYFECLLVLCASMLATSVSSAILGTFMCSLVILSRRFRINPDNIATPLASSLGDLLTLIILGLISSLFLTFMSTFVSTVVFFVLLGSIALHVAITLRNAYVQELLWSGWVPLIVAMIISSATGLVLEEYIVAYKGYGLVAPVLTGVVGNIGSIYISRISTALHAAREERYLVVGTTLFVVSTPILCLFLIFAAYTNQVNVTVGFALAYCIVTALMVALSLVLGYFIAVILWKFDYDPDMNALPLHSSIIDVVGQLILVVAFALTQNLLPPPVLPPAEGTPVITAFLSRRLL